MDDRIATGLWVETQLRLLDHKGIFYYIVNKGAYFSGSVVLKIQSQTEGSQILTQVRDENGKLVWMTPLKSEWAAEGDIDAYIRRSIDRDPDIWIIEVEVRQKSDLGEIFILT